MLTYITDVQGNESDILSAIRHNELIIRRLDGDVLTRQAAPAEGWTHLELMAVQPENCEEGADAYLGDHWVGSTEV